MNRVASHRDMDMVGRLVGPAFSMEASPSRPRCCFSFPEIFGFRSSRSPGRLEAASLHRAQAQISDQRLKGGLGSLFTRGLKSLFALVFRLGVFRFYGDNHTCANPRRGPGPSTRLKRCVC